MKIQLLDWNIAHLTYQRIAKGEREENSFDLTTGQSFDESSASQFQIAFRLDIRDQAFELNLEASFRFQIDQPITEAFKLSDFPRVNAPAIAFPFLRAYIANFTLQSGVDPVILPSINFTQLAEDAKQASLL